MNPGTAPLPESPWGPSVTVYFVLVGLVAGLSLVSCWRRFVRPWRISRADHVGTVLALAGTIVSGALLMADLGRIDRFFLMITRFDNLASPISIGAKILAVKAALLAVDLYLVRRASAGGRGLAPGDRPTEVIWRAVVAGAGACAVALAVYPVSVLDHTWLAPLAGTSGAMLLYALTTLLLGAAVQLILDRVISDSPPDGAGDLRGPLAALLTVTIVVCAFGALSAVSDPRAAAALTGFSMLGLGAATWWGIGTVVGLGAPAVALLRDRHGVAVAASAAVVSACLLRFLVMAIGP